MHVLLVESRTGGGRAALLELELLPDGAGELYQDPRCALPLEPAFAQACQVARKLAADVWGKREALHGGRLDVRWRLVAEDRAPLTGGLSGASMGAAFAVGLFLLLDPGARHHHSHVALTAALDPDGSLQPVAGIVEKLLAARHQVTDVIVASGQEYPAQTGSLRVHEARTLANALELEQLLSRTRQAFMDYAIRSYGKLTVVGGELDADAAYQDLWWLRPSEPVDEPAETDEPRQRPRHRYRPIRVEDALLSRHAEIADEDVDRELVASSDVFGPGEEQAPRLVVTAPPGAGKTALCQQIARRCAQGKGPWQRRSLMPVVVPIAEWFRWWQGAPETPLWVHLSKAYQASALAGADTGQTAQDLLCCLRAGQVLVLLDGVDEGPEADSGFWAHARDTLRGPAERCPVLITSRQSGYSYQFGDLPVYELAGLTTTQQRALLTAWFTAPGGRRRRQSGHLQADERAQRCLRQLQAHRRLRPLVASPMLLLMMADRSGLGGGRAQLYDTTIAKLMRRKPDMHPSELSHLQDKGRSAFAGAALALFEKGQRRSFPRDELVRAMAEVLQCSHHGDAGGLANQVTRHLIENVGLVQVLDDNRCYFLHPTFQEFLAAEALCRALGHDPSALLARLGASIRLGEWEEVVRFLFGLMDPPKAMELVRGIAQRYDAPSRAREQIVLLASSCLGEVGSQHSKTIAAPWVEQLLDELVQVLFGGGESGRPGARDALVSLGAFAPRAATRIEGVLDSGQDEKTRAQAAQALGMLAADLPSEDASRLLAKVLKAALASTDRFAILSPFRRAVEEIAMSVPNGLRGHLNELSQAALEASLPERRNAGWMLSAISSVAPQVAQELLPRALALAASAEPSLKADSARLLRLLFCQQWPPSRAPGALAQLAGPHAREVIDALSALAREPDSSTRADSARALGNLGAELPDHRAEVVTILLELIADPDPGVVYSAASAIGVIGEPAGRAAAGAVMGLFVHRHSSVRLQAVRAIRRLGPSALHSARPAIELLLGDEVLSVREAAVLVLGVEAVLALCSNDPGSHLPALEALANRNNRPWRPLEETELSLILDLLCQVMSNGDPETRRHAVMVMESILGDSRAAAQCVSCALSDDDAEVRKAAVDALSLQQPGVLRSRAVAALQADDATGRRYAAEALVQALRASHDDPEVEAELAGTAAALRNALLDQESGVRLPAAQAVSALAATVAWPSKQLRLPIADPVCHDLLALLKQIAETDPVATVRRAAVEAIRDSRMPETAEFHIRRLGNSDGDERRDAAYALGEARAREAVSPLIRLLAEDSSRAVRRAAAWALGEVGDVSAAEPLGRALRDEYEVALAAREALVKLGPASIPALREAARGPVEARDHAAWALRDLGATGPRVTDLRFFRHDQDE